jgi:hypothetical protein
VRPYYSEVMGRAHISSCLRMLADRVDATGEGVSIVCVVGPDPEPESQPMAIVLAPDAFGAIMHAAEYLARIVDDVPSNETSL